MCNLNDELFAAIVGGDLAGVESLINNGVNIDVRDERGRTPLLYAVSHSNTEIALALICAGADVNAQDIDGRAPIHLADGLQVFIALVQAGARVNVQIDRDRLSTPLHTAAAYNQIAIVIPLIFVGADVNAKNNLGETPLHLAAFHNHHRIASILLEGGACVGATNYSGDTPLEVAKTRGNLEVAAILENPPPARYR